MTDQQKPKIVVIGDTTGNIFTGEVYHAHGVHRQDDGSWRKGECPTCGFNYDESEYGMPPGKAKSDGPVSMTMIWGNRKFPL